MWFVRTPGEVAALVHDAVVWAEMTPRLRPEPSPAPPVILIGAWNEILEGSYLPPTVGAQHSFGDAIATDLARGTGKLRTALALEASPVDRGPPFLVAGDLRDEADASVPGSIAVEVQPLDGPGWVGRYSASGVVPGAAVDAYLSAYVNRDGVGPGRSTRLSMRRTSAARRFCVAHS